MQKSLKSFFPLSFGVSYPRTGALCLSFSKATMTASAKQGLFHSLWFSTSLRRTEHGSISSPLSRKKGIASCQGRIIQHENFTTCCSIKCVQSSSLTTGSVTLKHGLTMEDNAPYQQVQSSSSCFMNSWEKANERVGHNSQNDRSQAHTSFAIRGDRTGASKTFKKLSSYPHIGNSRKAWRQITDEWEQQKAQYSVNNAMPVEAPDIVRAVEKEEAARSILKERGSSQIYPFSTCNSNPFVQQSAHIFNGENIELASKPKEDDPSSVERKQKLTKIYDKVLVVDNVSTAEEVVQLLTTKYRNLIHACDTEASFPDDVL